MSSRPPAKKTLRGRPEVPEEQRLKQITFRFSSIQQKKLAQLGGPNDRRGNQWLRDIVEAAAVPRKRAPSRRITPAS